MEVSDMSLKELEDLWQNTVDLREKVNVWCKLTGFSASTLISDTAEHVIEMFYGRKKLEAIG